MEFEVMNFSLVVGCLMLYGLSCELNQWNQGQIVSINYKNKINKSDPC